MIITVFSACILIWIVTCIGVSIKKNSKRLRMAYQDAEKSFNYPVYCLLAKPDKVIDCSGKEQKISEDENYRVLFHQLSSESNVPSKAYAATFSNVSIDDKDDALCFTFRPETDICHSWTVTEISHSSVTCEHSVMGKIVLEILPPAFLTIGDTLELYQIATKVGNKYHLKYRL